MNIVQRKIGIVTSLGKIYSGKIDVPSQEFRTTDLLNSTNLFWKNPNEKCMDNAILLYEVELFLEQKAVYKRFNKLQIKTQEIIFFYDDYEALGNDMEKARADTIVRQSGEERRIVNIITRTVKNSFYDIEGTFFGQFKKKTHDNFIPLSNVTIKEIGKKEGKWFQKNIALPFRFAGISSGYIESINMGG